MEKGRKVVSHVAQLREQAGLTQKQLAEIIGTTVITISNWEQNRTGVQQLIRIAKLCKALNCAPEDLAEEIDET